MRMCPHRINEEVEFNDSTDPNGLWPQTAWEHVDDGRVTLAACESHALGSTGGAETHTLTVEQIPSHTHPIRSGYSENSAGSDAYRYQFWGASALGWKSGNLGAGSTGGGQAHNNMQPWRAVNRWRRVA